MARPDLDERLRRSGMQKYLLVGERPLVADHQHWAKIAEPVASCLAGLVLLIAIFASLSGSAGGIADVLVWAWLVLLGRAIWKVVLWRRNWFVATDKRILLNHGLINVDVAMLSLTKVVDLTYTRSTMGRLLRYGTFVRESAGQSQTLREVDWVKQPEKNYNLLCAAIFGLEEQSRRGGLRSEMGSPIQTAGSYAEFLPFEGTSSPQHRALTSDYSSGIRTRPASPQQDDSDSWRPDPSSEPDIHDADTGPIPTDDTDDADDADDQV